LYRLRKENYTIKVEQMLGELITRNVGHGGLEMVRETARR